MSGVMKGFLWRLGIMVEFSVGGWIYFDKQLYNTKIIIKLYKIKGIQ